jgi:hypothetical protein
MRCSSQRCGADHSSVAYGLGSVSYAKAHQQPRKGNQRLHASTNTYIVLIGAVSFGNTSKERTVADVV